MNKKFWGIISIIIGLLIILGILYFFFFYKPTSSEPAAVQPPQTGTAAVLPKENKEPAAAKPVSPEKKAEVTQDDLARMAEAFAERMGSFSNQSDYGNIRDLQIFMTAAMKAWAENYISDARAKKNDASIYYGIVTKSILSEVKQFNQDAGQAEILVKTQRRESTGVAGNNATYYQDITIKYLLERGVWRVDGAHWQGKQ